MSFLNVQRDIDRGRELAIAMAREREGKDEQLRRMIEAKRCIIVQDDGVARARL